MGAPKMPAVPQPAAAPTQEDPEVAAKMQEAEQTRKAQISNMRGRTSTIGTSTLGDTGEIEGFKVSLLGGRVAEQLILNDISTGASNDIERASKIARSMVMRYGMSEKLGTITFGNDQEEVFLGRDINNVRNYSEDIAAVIDIEVKRIVDNGYNRAKTILEQHVDKLHKVASVLLEKEKIEAEEFEAIMNS